MPPKNMYFTLNGAVLLFFLLFTWIVRPTNNYTVFAGLFVAQISIILFIVNVNMYFTTLVIRKSTDKTTKIRFVKISRALMKWHIPIALVATALILIHATIMLVSNIKIVGIANPKIVSGLIALFFLAINLIAGYRRHQRASGSRRKLHLYAAMVFTLLFVIHMVMPSP